MNKVIFSWELNSYSFECDNEDSNIEFARHMASTMTLDADIRFVYGGSDVQRQLFPEFGQFRDLCLWWKWSLCPDKAAHRFRAYSLISSVSYLIRQKIIVLDNDQNPFELVQPSQMPSTMMAYKSLANPVDYIGKEVYDENDVLYVDNLPDFDSNLGQRDAELLVSYLTAPYLRVPLLLQFFAADDRINSLQNQSLRDCLSSAISESGRYIASTLFDSDEGEEKALPTEIPCSDSHLLATTHGLLVSELQHAPHAVLGPLQKLVLWAIDAAALSIREKTFKIVLFVVRLASRIVAIGNYLIKCWSGRVPGFEVWARCIRSTESHKNQMKLLIASLENSLVGVSTSPGSPQNQAFEANQSGGQVKHSMSSRLIECLMEMERNCAVDCGSGAFQSNDKHGIEISEDDMSFFLQMRNEIHAHITLLYGSCSNLNEKSCSTALASVCFLTTRHAWGKNSLQCNETELMASMDSVRICAMDFLEHCADRDMKVFTDVCNKVVSASLSAEHIKGTWSRVTECKGKYVLDLSSNIASPFPNVVPYVSDGEYAIELDLNTIELRVAGGFLQSLDEDIIRNEDVHLVLGKNSSAFQCIRIFDSEHCRERKTIGVKTPVLIRAWTEENKMDALNAFEREYAPLELDDNEIWISELFEPVRSKLFAPKECEKEVQFFIPNEPYKSSVQVAVLLGAHPKKSGAWFEVLLLKDFQVVHVFLIESYGRRFLREAYYTTNAMLSFFHLHPNLQWQRPREAWKSWARHEAAHDNFGPIREEISSYPPYPRSCMLIRQIPATVLASPSENDKELFLPSRFLAGLIPQALTEYYIFWQDMGLPHLIRGYVKEPGPQADSQKVEILIELQKLENVPATGLKGVCARVTRRKAGSDREDILLNILHSPSNSVLSSIARSLCCAEYASFMLVWGREKSGVIEVSSVEMKLLGISFVSRILERPDGQSIHLLFSEDQSNLYIANEHPPSKFLLDGISQYIPLYSLEHEWSVWVPNVRFVRPIIKGRPFSCEIVVDPKEEDWCKKRAVTIFSFSIHPSGCNLLSNGLCSSLYLLVLKMLRRDYTDVSRMIASISTDAELTEEEEQILECLEQSCHDHHPDAHACRVKIYLALLDCPVGLPWDIVVEIGHYFLKLRHVSAACRLSTMEERNAIRASRSVHQVQVLLTDLVSNYGKQNVNRWRLILTDTEFRLNSSANDRKDAEDFITTLCEIVKSKTDLAIHRKRLLSLLSGAVKYTRTDFQRSPLWKAIVNRDRVLKARFNGENIIACLHAPRVRTSGWQFSCDKSVLADHLTVHDMNEELIYEKRRHLGGLAAVALAVEAWIRPLDIRRGFLLVYEILSGNLVLDFLGSSSHSYGCLLYFIGFNDSQSGSVLGSILSLIYHNAAVCTVSSLPRLHDTRVNKRSSTWRTRPDGREPNIPLSTLLEQIISYFNENASHLVFPPEFSNAALPAVQYVYLGDTNHVLDSCPPCQVQDFQRELRCIKYTFADACNVLLEHCTNKDKLLAFRPVHDSDTLQALCSRPFFSSVKSYVRECDPVHSSTMPFDEKPLLEGASDIEKQIILRLKNDFKTLSELECKNKILEIQGLDDGMIDKIVSSDLSVSNSARDAALSTIKAMEHTIAQLKADDHNAFNFVKSVLENVANGKSKDESRFQYGLLRMSGHRPQVTLHFLVQTLLSSCDSELSKINNNIDEEVSAAGTDLLCIGLLHAIRSSTANQVLSQLHSLRSVLQSPVSPSKDVAKLVLKQKCAALCDVIGSHRSYFDEVSKQFMPHFLVFEFQSSMMLRVRQVEIVQDIIRALKSDDRPACVKQMIMGAGKTCVVSPLLSLILPEVCRLEGTRSLVIQVVPPALLDFSRGVMRSTLSNAFGKLVCTLLFERCDTINSKIIMKIKNAAESGAVIVTTPSSLKSLMLKFVENTVDFGNPRNRQRRESQRQIKEASQLFNLLQNSIIVMDEVDMILHPLKSELNFPFGRKFPLEPPDIRWNFPLFLLDAFMAAGQPNQNADSQGALDKLIYNLSVKMKNGADQKALQKRPHWILLSKEFYDQCLIEFFLDLSVLWCDRQGVRMEKNVMKLYLKESEEALQKFQFRSELDFLQRLDRCTLNLVSHWLHLILPHILQKVDRVSFGLMTQEECKKSLKRDPLTPRARHTLAIPFVGKDTPSDASEFAHPDVTIGLTILAYRYEGLRMQDFNGIIRTLQEKLAKELGPKKKRPSALLYKSWVEMAGGTVASGDRIENTSDEFENAQVTQPLHSLRIGEFDKSFNVAFELLRKQSAVIHFYLGGTVFPRYMQHQRVKLSASAQKLGSSMLFGRRVGFSGTPSSLIPVDLGTCEFEPGSEARILRTLSSDDVCGIVLLENAMEEKEWSPTSILEYILKKGKYHALIDTGALVTGFSNLQVAQYLLEGFTASGGLAKSIEGVVYIDDMGRKMVSSCSSFQK